MGEVIHKLFSGGLATSTLKSYRSYTNKYTWFAQVVDSLHSQYQNTWLAYLAMAFLYQEGLAGSSAKSYLAAFWYIQIAISLGDQKMAEWPRLSYVKGDSRC